MDQCGRRLAVGLPPAQCRRVRLLRPAHGRNRVPAVREWRWNGQPSEFRSATACRQRHRPLRQSCRALRRSRGLKMRIVHVIDSGGLYGAETVLLTLASEQIRRGDVPVILSMGGVRAGEKALEVEAERRKIDCETLRMH